MNRHRGMKRKFQYAKKSTRISCSAHNTTMKTTSRRDVSNTHEKLDQSAIYVISLNVTYRKLQGRSEQSIHRHSILIKHSSPTFDATLRISSTYAYSLVLGVFTGYWGMKRARISTSKRNQSYRTLTAPIVHIRSREKRTSEVWSPSGAR